MKRTDKGELSVVVTSWTMLTKAIQPLPDKWHGLADVEARYRRRYVDMIVTPGVTDTLRARSKTISALRRALEDRGFLEVGGVGWRVGWGSWAWEMVQPWLKPSGCNAPGIADPRHTRHHLQLPPSQTRTHTFRWRRPCWRRRPGVLMRGPSSPTIM